MNPESNTRAKLMHNLGIPIGLFGFIIFVLKYGEKYNGSDWYPTLLILLMTILYFGSIWLGSASLLKKVGSTSIGHWVIFMYLLTVFGMPFDVIIGMGKGVELGWIGLAVIMGFCGVFMIHFIFYTVDWYIKLQKPNTTPSENSVSGQLEFIHKNGAPTAVVAILGVSTLWMIYRQDTFSIYWLIANVAIFITSFLYIFARRKQPVAPNK